MENLARLNFRKDVRHMKWLLGVWFLLVLIHAALAGSGIGALSTNLAWSAFFGTLQMILPVLQILTLLVIIPLWIQDDALAGSTAFWLTRPMSTGDLLVSKSAFGTLFLILPLIVVEGFVLALNDANARQMLIAAGETLLSNSQTVIVIALFAAITATFTRYMIVILATFVGAVLISILVMALSIFRDPSSLIPGASDATLAASGALVSGIFTVIASCAILAFQFRARRAMQSVIFIVAVYGISFIVSSYWPWDFLETRLPSNPPAYAAGPVTARLNSQSVTVGDHFTFGGQSPRKEISTAELTFSNIQSGYEVVPTAITASLLFPDGDSVSSTAPDLHGFFDHGDQRALGAVLGGRMLNRDMPNFRRNTLLILDAEKYHSLIGRSGRLSARVEADVFEYYIAGSAPLEKGNRISNGVREAVMTNVLRSPGVCTLFLRERYLNLSWDVNDILRTTDFPKKPWAVHVLRHRKTREFILPEMSGGQTDFSMMAGANHLVIRPLRLEFQWPSESAWFDDAELVRIEARLVGRIAPTMVIEDLTIPAQNSARPHLRAAQDRDTAALTAIKLPPNPSRDDVRRYISAIIGVSGDRHSWSAGDREVAMLEAVGPEHLDLLLDVYDVSYYVKYAARNLAGDEHQALVLGRLAENPELIDIVSFRPWTKDARDTVLKLVAARPEHLPHGIIEAAASYREPASYGALMDYLIFGPNRGGTYDALSTIPGLNLDTAVARAWREEKASPLFKHTASDLIPAAIAYGHRDALDRGVELLEDADQHMYAVRRAAEAFRRHTPAKGSRDEIVGWYRRNGNRLVYDAKSKRWRLN